MKDIKESQLFTELTSEEESSVSGGAIPWAVIAGLAAGAGWVMDRVSGVYIDPDGNPNTRNNFVAGDFNQRSTQWKGVKWEVRWNGETALKGYGNTPSWLSGLIKKRFGR